MNKYDVNREINMAETPEQQSLQAQHQRLMQQQIADLTVAFQNLRAQNNLMHNQPRNIMKEISYMSIFTGRNEISINSFISSAEYHLSTVTDPDQKKQMTRAIFYEKIQGEAKNAVINIPDPSDWNAGIENEIQTGY